jgi:hypothetical protein
MRNFGLSLMLIGAIGFLYCSSEIEHTEPMPPNVDVVEGVRFYPRGRLEVGRFAGVAGVAIGLLMAAASKGR